MISDENIVMLSPVGTDGAGVLLLILQNLTLNSPWEDFGAVSRKEWQPDTLT